MRGKIRQNATMGDTSTLPTTTSNTTTTTQSPTTSQPADNSDTAWIVAGASIGAFFFVFLVFAISLFAFMKWKRRRRTEGAYNPSRAEGQSPKNQFVFAIPLPNPERLI